VETHKTLRNSTIEGAAASAMSGLTGGYITPYALTMQATTQQIGYLTSLPNFANSFIQLISPFLSEHVNSRKTFLLPLILMQAVLWLPILAIPFLFQTNQFWWLLAFITLSTAAGALVGPPFSSMMADLVPMRVRGSYFGGRSRICNFVSLLFSFIAGGLLQLFTGNIRLAFAIVFIGAFISRLISFYFLSLMLEPRRITSKTVKKESIIQITKGLFATNIGRIIIVSILLNLSTSIAGPFFSAYMLRELKFSYINYQLVSAASTVVRLLVVTWWGKRADKAGSVKILRITGWMIPFVPLLWLLSSNVYWIFCYEAFSGFAWAGFELCIGLFVYDASPQENRTRYIAISGTLGSIGTTLGSLIGGTIGPHLPLIKGSYFLTLFLISGIARLMVVSLLLRRVSEVRDVPPTRTLELIFGSFRISSLAAHLKAFCKRIKDMLFKNSNGR